MFRLSRNNKSQFGLGTIAVVLVLIAAGGWGVATFFDHRARNVDMREAVEENDIEKAKQLLAAGASPDGRSLFGQYAYVSHDGYRPLVHAINEHNDVMVRLLVESGAELYFGDPKYYESAVRWALYRCNQAAVVYFVYEAPGFDTQREDVDEMLRLSADCGYFELVDYWIENGADARGKANKNGDMLGTPLNRAVMNGYPAIARVLIEHGAPVDIVSEGYPPGTPLAVACAEGSPEMVVLLLELDADPNQESRGVLPLYYAVMQDDVDTIRLLLAAGADPTLTDPDGDNAITIAQQEGKIEIVQLLTSWTPEDAIID